MATPDSSPVPADQVVDHAPATIFNPVFAQKAEDLRPDLCRQPVTPLRTVVFQSDELAYFQRTPIDQYTIPDLAEKAWGKGEEFVLDFGNHFVGHLEFRLTPVGVNVDAPARLRLTFGEVPPDVTEELHPCKSWISSSWIPDEVFNIDWMPITFTVPRRHAFRFVRVQILDTSSKYKIKFSDIVAQSLSSVTIEQEEAVEAFPVHDERLRQIDAVSMRTLRNCMQTVFEDGPRRDRRIWSGDLRLQALTNYCTFKNYDMVKRCLYLFAALVREDDSLPACLFEKPVLTPASDYIVDYDALFGAIVRDYVVASGDTQTAEELWPVVLGSVKCALAHVQSGVFTADATTAWKFLDWAGELDKNAGMHGVVIVALKAINDLARILSKPPPFETELAILISTSDTFYDAAEGVFVSGKDRQVSWASQAWMALAGVKSPELLKAAMMKAMADPKAVKPLTPYLYHHVAEALCTVGGEQECLELIQGYWGGMVDAGADTFWECFDPEDSRSSPYGDYHNNSFCHAWSCTPSYLLRVKMRDWLVAKYARSPAGTGEGA